MEIISEKLIILGSGCAGLTAAVYAARGGLNPLVVEGDRPGGQLTMTSEVENFSGFPGGIGGYELMDLMRQQATKFGTRFESDTIRSLEIKEGKKVLHGLVRDYVCDALIVATGASPRMLGVKGESEYFGGKGVSVCATCDGAFYRNQEVAVIGGGDSAVGEAIFLTRFCSKVYLVYHREEFKASKILVDRLLANPKIEVIRNVSTKEILGNGQNVTGLRLEDVKTHEMRDLACTGVFLAIGYRPNTDFAKDVLKVDNYGYFATEPAGSVFTEHAGIFIAGDCGDPIYRQAIVAAGTGARAAISAEHYLMGVK